MEERVFAFAVGTHPGKEVGFIGEGTVRHISLHAAVFVFRISIVEVRAMRRDVEGFYSAMASFKRRTRWPCNRLPVRKGGTGRLTELVFDIQHFVHSHNDLPERNAQ